MKLRNSLLIVWIALIAGLTWISGSNAYAENTPTPTPAKFVKLPDPTEPAGTDIDAKTLDGIDLEALPIVPEISSHVLTIYLEGKRLGNKPSVFTKDGDCMTATPHFLIPFAQGKGGYDLGTYTDLQKVIDYFQKTVVRKDEKGSYSSFSNPSQTAASGFNTPSIFDPTWADPQVCKGDESPLQCEYRLLKPSIALIMFGTNDVKSIDAAHFDYYLRRLVADTANAGIVPILSTFPQEPSLVDKSTEYNRIIARIAQDYDVPLINLWRALEPLPNHGVDPVNTTHMTQPEGDDSISFAPDKLQYGFNVRNLLTLQTLQAVLKVVNPAALK
ncbi:MAG TPA: SGNH/GDSL hydrolase family protein [Aggregatilineales bacterium]|nr:SGNH/GDSL hydrolase family protein [Aggregatilineales bacterium]